MSTAAMNDTGARIAKSRAVGRADDGWVAGAECAGMDPAMFFPLGYGRDHASDVAAAKEVCARCEVRSECYAFAVTARETDGILGGLTPEERRRIRRRRSV